MIDDLAAGPSGTLTADVAVVGAGIAGLILADRLAAIGRSVVVLESGGADANEGVHPLNAVDLRRAPYAGATEGRARGLGGTSTRWGGALLPFLPEDLEARPDLGRPAWPVTFSELSSHIAAAETLFGLAPGPYEPDLTGWPRRADAAFVVREAKWPPFANRNVARLMEERLSAADGPRIVLNAHVCCFEVTGDARIAAVTARPPDGAHALNVKAGSFVLATGALEATRLLLWLDRLTEGRAVAGRELLGKSFQDHLSMPLAAIETEAPARLNHLAAFRFDRGTMRSIRFELAPATQRARSCAAGFVHIAPRALKRSGFEDVKDFYRSVQRRRPDVGALLRAAADAPFIAELVRWRIVHRRLYWPRPAAYEVHFVVEQAARLENEIGLSDKIDAFGMPLATISWDRTEEDLHTFRTLTGAFADYFAETPLSRTGNLSWPVPPADLTMTDISASGDIYHPVGSTRMASSASEGVVDGGLGVFGVPNLFVAATSTFPNGGGANPTMMLVAMALRLTERIHSASGTVRGTRIPAQSEHAP